MRATRTELTGPRDKSKHTLLVDLEASEQVRSINHERKHRQRRNARNKLLTANEDICHPRESCLSALPPGDARIAVVRR